MITKKRENVRKRELMITRGARMTRAEWDAAKEYAELETKRVGYPVSQTSVIRRAVRALTGIQEILNRNH